jgi:hypothetical protein
VNRRILSIANIHVVRVPGFYRARSTVNGSEFCDTVQQFGGLTVNRVRIGLLAGAAILAANAAVAQEIGWLDLIDSHPRERIRAPHGLSLGCGGGSGFAPSVESTITLVSLDKVSYSLGEEVTYEVKIQNSGKETIEIPWTPHSGDLEPADASKSYTYLHAAISLNFTEADSNRTFSLYANSYGSSEVTGTTRKLMPGEWTFVRARQKLETHEEWWWTKIKDSAPLNVRASASLMLNKVTYSTGEKTDSAMDHYVCIPVNTKLGPPSDVVLWPAKLE